MSQIGSTYFARFMGRKRTKVLAFESGGAYKNRGAKGFPPTRLTPRSHVLVAHEKQRLVISLTLPKPYAQVSRVLPERSVIRSTREADAT